ncbi:hypothetical protein PCANC_01919 [Puccinia coronata f. sp. avenae]|uniref:Uncharacterized protein n=1 Tax=Puccinia coronata f. sp. avenae TaxID=200324 RepID=A0A2N5TD44_9BASI|nr:hypothetical protein PCANC_12659 [Puccinia coronata f. sp. avenae]PLW23435.1 hypothetical protein PCASD_12736 [Puccinia coronata f. sp. avenae]PLW51907.1 hypothetical protein PCASD_00819 [Puccinia coronata f. sp. avenae]PLW57068.1 hypothetical protein PCANC_01919 [Puccinia coronata f. sp. avenae]
MPSGVKLNVSVLSSRIYLHRPNIYLPPPSLAKLLIVSRLFDLTASSRLRSVATLPLDGASPD